MFTKKTVIFRFIFYSLFTAALVGLGAWISPDESRNFFQSWQLWKEPLLAGIFCGFLSALLGVYILLNRIVFISLAISQSAGFGIFLALWVGGMFSLNLAESPLAFVAGLVAASLTALLFAGIRKSRRLPDESFIGMIYVVASGLTVLAGDRVAEGHHHIDNLLFGNAVAVTSSELTGLLIFGCPLILLHYLFRREFLYGSADPEFMRIKGLNAKGWIALLYFTLVVGITINLRVLGGLPVFALMVIPPILSLKRAQGLREAFFLSLFLGSLLPPLGYFFSFLFSFPTGASLIAVGFIYLAAGLLEWRLLKLFTARRAAKKNPADARIGGVS
jgi:zinc transport system permease protein